MKSALFTLSGCVTMDSYDFEISSEFSCTYTEHRNRGEDRTFVVIDIGSIKRQVWRDGKATWVDDHVPAEVINGIEERLEKEIEEEEFRVRVMNEDDRRLRA